MPETNVLLVADDAAQRQSLAYSLSEGGYGTRIAANCLEAIRAFSSQQPSVVYLELQSSVFGAPETASILRSLEKDGHRVPILATVPTLDADRDRYLTAGVDRLLTPPLNRDTLRRALVDVAMDATRRPAARPESAQSAVARRASAIDLNGALGRLGGDKSLLADLIQFFFEDAFGLVVAMHQAIVEQKWDDARRAAHSLKGLASNFGAAHAVPALQAIENCDRATASTETATTMNRLAAVADEEVLWLAAALGEYSATTTQEASR